MPPRFSEEMWDFVTPPDYASLEAAVRDLYEIQGLSLEAVGKKLGVSKTPLLWKLPEMGIVIRAHGGYRWGKRKDCRG